MSRRWPVLACAVALALTAPQATGSYAAAATGTPAATSGVAADPAPVVEKDLDRLRADAGARLRVRRAADGTVAHVSSTNGLAMVEARGTRGPARTASDQLTRYGDAFGIDGARSRAVVQQTLPSATGGSVVRADQVVDGIKVFGGQLVMSLDKDLGVVSVDAATTQATEVPPALVSEATAQRAALAVVAKVRHTPVRALSVTSLGRRLYDPAIMHTTDPRGVRPVWQFGVGNGSNIRETVLVGTGRGEIALHFNDAPKLNRVVCDDADAGTVSTDDGVPACNAPARAEGGSVSLVNDVNDAYDNLGATADTFQAVDGVDLTTLIGVGSPRSLMATVRWCFTDDDCPYQNAFWDGRQMVFGQGYAGADDVVGHELTHGYVERTAGLFAYHQSGSLNESVADVMGEIVDHRNPLSTGDDSAWTVGEDLPGDQQRSLKDPTLHGQPDRITSSQWDAADVTGDNGAVHSNDGVGNKTAYLVSQGTSALPGGTFNGQTISAGIDDGDPGLAKTGRLWLETIKRLTSGAEYSDFALTLGTTCDALATAGTGGFSVADCVIVRKATTATELDQTPTVAASAAPEVPVSCPGGSVLSLIERDDDHVDGFGFTSASSLWGRAPSDFVPSYAVSGTASLFGLDPDPGLDDPALGDVTSAPFTVPATTGGTFVNFHHAYVFEYDDQANYDGGRLIVSKLVGGSWTPVTDLPWVNGPDRHIEGNSPAGFTGFTGFGGDSYGYGSSQVDLSSLVGQRVRVTFRVEGDSGSSFLGWWIDDVRLYGCDTAALPPAAPVSPTAPTAPGLRAAFSSAVVFWQPPVDQGSRPISAYRVTRSDRKVVTVPGTSRSAGLTGFNTAAPQTVAIQAINGDGLVGGAAYARIYPTSTSVAAPVKVKKKQAFTITAKVLSRGSSSVIAGMPLTLQRRAAGQSYWSNVSTGATTRGGTKVWSLRQKKATSYRVLAKGSGSYFGSTSATRLVKKR